jgi:hypothetical protein
MRRKQGKGDFHGSGTIVRSGDYGFTRQTLAHPGGNATGLSLMTSDLSGKRLALLKEAVPHLSRIAILVDRTVAFSERTIKAYQAAADALREPRLQNRIYEYTPAFAKPILATADVADASHADAEREEQIRVITLLRRRFSYKLGHSTINPQGSAMQQCLQLVHRRLRHARSERGQGAARPAPTTNQLKSQYKN